MKASHVKCGEVPMKMMEVGLTEEILAHWKKHRNIDQQFQDVRETRLQWPEGSHQRGLQIPRLANLGEHIGKEAERREGIRLDAIPTLPHASVPMA